VPLSPAVNSTRQPAYDPHEPRRSMTRRTP
jgi:hypothetical protein